MAQRRLEEIHWLAKEADSNSKVKIFSYGRRNAQLSVTKTQDTKLWTRDLQR